jgi:hypothetical protein
MSLVVRSVSGFFTTIRGPQIGAAPRRHRPHTMPLLRDVNGGGSLPP